MRPGFSPFASIYSKISLQHFVGEKIQLWKSSTGAAPVVQRFSAACRSGRDPGDPGSSPTSGSLHGACFSLCLCLCLSLSLYVSHGEINKIFKTKQNKRQKWNLRSCMNSKEKVLPITSLSSNSLNKVPKQRDTAQAICIAWNGNSYRLTRISGLLTSLPFPPTDLSLWLVVCSLSPSWILFCRQWWSLL